MPNTLTKIPHVKQIALKKETFQQLMCARLGWSEEEYYNFQFDAAYEFLGAVLHPATEEDRRLLTRSSVFWGWWRNQWLKRDQQCYQWSIIRESSYIYLHTTELLKCEYTITGFWNHVESMLEAGMEAIRQEAGI